MKGGGKNTENIWRKETWSPARYYDLEWLKETRKTNSRISDGEVVYP